MGGGWSTPPSGRGTPLGHRVVSYGPTKAETAQPHVPQTHVSQTHAPESHAPETHDPETHVPQTHAPESHAVAARRRHCWVRSPAGADAQPEVPGLVLDWRRGPDQIWWGFTQYVVEGTGGTRAILEWLPAHRLRPR